MSPAPVMSQTWRGRAGKSRALARRVRPGHAVAVQRHQRRLDAEAKQPLGRLQALLRRGDSHARGQARLGPIGRDAGAAGIAMIVGVADRIGNHRHAGRAGQLHQPRDHLPLAHALVVVAHQHAGRSRPCSGPWRRASRRRSRRGWARRPRDPPASSGADSAAVPAPTAAPSPWCSGRTGSPPGGR